jgi:hypothetical protein
VAQSGAIRAVIRTLRVEPHVAHFALTFVPFRVVFRVARTGRQPLAIEIRFPLAVSVTTIASRPAVPPLTTSGSPSGKRKRPGWQRGGFGLLEAPAPNAAARMTGTR